jgi:hypothetical protein
LRHNLFRAGGAERFLGASSTRKILQLVTQTPARLATFCEPPSAAERIFKTASKYITADDSSERLTVALLNRYPNKILIGTGFFRHALTKPEAP